MTFKVLTSSSILLGLLVVFGNINGVCRLVSFLRNSGNGGATGCPVCLIVVESFVLLDSGCDLRDNSADFLGINSFSWALCWLQR